MTPTLITETKPEDWTYISEGGATIVFSYRGPHNVQFSDHVLRLRKVAHGSSDNTLLDTNSEQPDDPMIAFQENIISKLVPSEFLPSLAMVVLDEDWLRSLVILRDGDRPAERRQTDQIDVRRTKGVLATDLIGVMPIAMEIKVVASLLGEYLGLTNYLAEMGIFTYRIPSLAWDCRSEDRNVQILYAYELQNGTGGRRYDLLPLGPFLFR